MALLKVVKLGKMRSTCEKPGLGSGRWIVCHPRWQAWLGHWLQTQERSARVVQMAPLCKVLGDETCSASRDQARGPSPL